MQTKIQLFITEKIEEMQEKINSFTGTIKKHKIININTKLESLGNGEYKVLGQVVYLEGFK